MDGGAVGHNFEKEPPLPGLGFRGEDLNVIFYQNMPNLHNRYISAERNPENMLNYFLPCSAVKI